MPRECSQHGSLTTDLKIELLRKKKSLILKSRQGSQPMLKLI